MRALCSLASRRVCLAAVVLLLLLSALTMPLSSHAQTASKLYSTRPMLSYTFDTDPTQTYFPGRTQPQMWGSSGTWSQGAGSHTGVIAMDGATDYVDLKYFPDNDGLNFTSMLWGEEVAVEVWASWTALDSWSRLIDFGGPVGLNDDNVYIANGWTGSLIVYQVYNGTSNDGSQIWYDAGVNLYNWQHVVITATRNPSAGSNPNTAAILTLYVNGVQVQSTTGFLPKVMSRPNSFIGKSNWAAWGDQLFRGLFDDVFIYNYSLSAEAVAAHYLVPRVAQFELTFAVDPRINMNMVNQPSVTYGWQLSDPNDSSNAHKGMLVLSGNQYLDVGATSGFSSVGTSLPAIGGNGWSAADNDTTGWTFEVTIKFTEITPNACIFDFFSTGSSTTNRVALCFSQTGTSLLLTVQNPNSNNGISAAMDVLTSLSTGRWYHISVNIQPLDIGSVVGRYEAFVDGVYSNSINNGVWLAGGSRASYIGRSYAGVYVKALIDNIRVYDYALTASEVKMLYRTVSGLSTTGVTPLYQTGPSISHTFDVDVPWGQRAGGTRLGWTSVVDNHAGNLWLVATDTQFVNLLTLPDRNLNLFPGFIGGRSISFEFWIKWNSFTAWARVIDLSGADYGQGAYMDNIFIATLSTSSILSGATLVFAVDAGPTGSTDGRFYVDNAVYLNRWYHLVATVKVDRTVNMNLTTSAQLQMYLDGVLIGQANSAVPRYLNRPNSWIGRSRYSPDGYLPAYIDSFHYYDYALEAEQARAHSCVVRPPMFELTFSSAPSTQPLMNATTRYGWVISDQGSSTQGQANHPGLLTLTASSLQYVDLTVANGPLTVGTVMPLLASLSDSKLLGTTFEFLPNQAQLRYGMTFEFAFKYNTAAGANAKLFSCGTSSLFDLIEIGFAQGSRDLLFNVQNTEVLRSDSSRVYTSLLSTRWYHVTIVLRSYNAQYGAALTAYVDGIQVLFRRNALFPYATPRDFCMLGRGVSGAADTYFDGFIDVFRVYDYALNGTEVATIFNKISPQTDPTAPPIVVPSTTPDTSNTGDSASSSSSLSGGAVAGIVIACVVGVILLAVLSLWYLRSAKGTSGAAAKESKRERHVELSEVSEVREEEHESA